MPQTLKVSDHNKTGTHCHAVKLTVRGLDRVRIAVKGIPVIATTDTGGNARVSDQENEVGIIKGLQMAQVRNSMLKNHLRRVGPWFKRKSQKVSSKGRSVTAGGKRRKGAQCTNYLRDVLPCNNE